VLCLLGGCAAISLLASDMARGPALPAAFASLSWGIWLAWRESRSPRRIVAISTDGRVEIDGEHVRDFRLEWRGVLAFGRWIDASGRIQRLVWWPDTLPPARARELRLAMPVETAPRPPR